MKERRNATIEMVLLELGEIKQVGSDTRERLNQLVERVGIQNGRVGKLEISDAEKKGAINTIKLFMIPLGIMLLGYCFNWVINHIKFPT